MCGCEFLPTVCRLKQTSKHIYQIYSTDGLQLHHAYLISFEDKVKSDSNSLAMTDVSMSSCFCNDNSHNGHFQYDFTRLAQPYL